MDAAFGDGIVFFLLYYRDNAFPFGDSSRETFTLFVFAFPSDFSLGTIGSTRS